MVTTRQTAIKSILLALLLISTFFSFGQKYKVLEKSSKKPGWLGLTERKFLIVSAQGATLEEAKDNVLRTLREQIISSIAINVQSSTQMSITNTNGSTNEQMTVKIKSKAANLSFVQGISLSKAEGSYWEKVQYPDGKVLFGIHIRYPFSDTDLQALIDEFDRQQSEILQKLNYLESLLDTLQEADRAENLLKELLVFENQVFDDQSERMRMLKEKLNTRFLQTNILIDNLIQDKLYIYFLVGGKTGKLPSTARFRSNCAKITRVDPTSDGGYVLQLFDNSCLYEAEPKLHLTYIFAQTENKVTQSFYPQSFVLKLQLEEPVNIYQGSPLRFDMMLKSNQTEALNLKEVYMTLKNGQRLTLQNLKQTKTGTKWNLQATCTNCPIATSSDAAFPMATFEISGTFGAKNTPFSKKIDGIRYRTDW